jgi:hypothetical protein
MAMRGRGVVSVVLTLSIAVSGCASAKPGLPLGGRTVELRGTEPKSPKVSGELLAVGPEQVLVLTSAGVRGVPASQVKEARVLRHGLTGRKAWLWVAIGALGTGLALTAACASVEDTNCGGVLGVTIGAWGLIGGPAAASLAKSSQLRVKGPDFTPLRPYARFPQGLPEGLDPASLGVSGRLGALGTAVGESDRTP